MPKKKIPRGIFLVLRLPLLVLLSLAIFLGFSYGGWRFYFQYRRADPVGMIRRGMRDRIAGLESYHARFRTIPVGQENELTYCVEIWKKQPGRYRVEMSTERRGRQTDLQVVIGDRDRCYYYDHDRAGFIPAADPAEGEITGTFLEDYWCSIGEAASLSYIGEKRSARHSYYQIETIPSQPHRCRVSERVWLEQDSFLPVRVESFDAAGRLTQVTVFELLQLNPVLEAALFQAETGPTAVEGLSPGR